jgi:hypothetical protein
MLSATKAPPAAVYLLADNLDAALAAGEDLLKSCITWHAGNSRSAEEVEARRIEERSAAEAIRTLEMIAVARLLKSRERAAELAKLDPHIKPVAKLYNAGTVLLTDAIKELGDPAAHDFDAGDGITSYLRTRGLIAPDVAAPDEAQELPVTEEFLIGGRIALGTLMDLVAMFLDTLEIHYDLYEEPERRRGRGLLDRLASISAEAIV